MAMGCVFHSLFVFAVLSLSLLNQGWGVPKHYLVETKDGDNFIVGTQKDDNYVVGTQDDDNNVVGIHDNLARTDQDAFNKVAGNRIIGWKWGNKKRGKPKRKTTRKPRRKTTRKPRRKTTRKPKRKPQKVDGGWSVWSSWSSCGVHITMTRTRQCNNPAPSYGGASCTGPSDDQALCPGKSHHKAWTDSQCGYMAHFAGNLEDCKAECKLRRGCTAFNLCPSEGFCTLQACPVPAPVPEFSYKDCHGYMDMDMGG